MISNLHEWTLIVGRTLAGVSHAINMITILIHASEVASHPAYRHKVLLIAGILMAFSNLPAAILIPQLSIERTNISIGIQYFVLAVLAFIVNSYYTKESPTFLLFRHELSGIIEPQSTYDLFKFLQAGAVPIYEFHTEYERLKAYVAGEREQSWRVTDNGNFRSLLLCINVRLIGVLSFNLAACYYVITVQNLAVATPESNSSMVMIIFYLLCGSITTLFTYGQRHRLFLVVIVFAFLHSAVLILYAIDTNWVDIYVNVWPAVIAILTGLIYVYCFAMPLDVLGWLAVGEAFAPSKKPISIAITIMCEHLLHVLLIVAALLKFDMIMYTGIACGLLITSWIAFKKLPRETENLPLDKCPDAYKRRIII